MHHRFRDFVMACTVAVGLVACQGLLGVDFDDAHAPGAPGVDSAAPDAGGGQDAPDPSDALVPPCEGGACGIAHGTAVLYGGTDSAGNLLSDTWTFDGARWTLVPFANPPPPRQGAYMAALHGRVVLFGGPDNGTWSFDGAAWTRVTPLTSPPALVEASIATLGDKIVLFGGYVLSPGLSRSNDTWTFDGMNWTKLPLTGAPPARDGAAMTEWNGRLVLVGGAWDPPDGGPFLLSDTWAFDGLRWTQLNAPGLTNAESGYDSSLAALGSRLVRWGGELPDGASDQTWVFDGASWTQINAAPAPRGKKLPFLEFDQRLVLFGGFAPQGNAMDAWSFDGAHWTELTLKAPPSGRLSPLMAYVP